MMLKCNKGHYACHSQLWLIRINLNFYDVIKRTRSFRILVTNNAVPKSKHTVKPWCMTPVATYIREIQPQSVLD